MKREVPGWGVLAVCCAAQFMVVLDVSIINVALPSMRAGVHLSTADEQWIVNAYTLGFAGFLLFGGRAADLFGRRRVFLIGLGIFTVCSLLGGLAEDGGQLIAARAVQGVGGAILVPATLSLLTTTFTVPSTRRRAVGAWSAVAAAGSAVGVLAGGVLTDLLDWRWVLIVNVPIGAALVVLARRWLAESRAELPSSLDAAGALTVTGGLALAVYGIDTTSRSWTSPTTVTVLVSSAALLGAFAVIESRLAAQPLVPLAIFRRRSVAVANAIGMTIGAAVYATFFFTSIYLQQVNGYDALAAGLAFLPAALAVLGGALMATRTAARIGTRTQLMLGPLAAATGLVWLSRLSAHDDYLTHVFGPLVLAGLGFGLSFVPMTMAATGGVPADQAGLASGLVNTSRQIGGAVGLAAFTTIAAGASRPVDGDARAFEVSAAVLLIGAALAALLPRETPTPTTAEIAETADQRDMWENSVEQCSR